MVKYSSLLRVIPFSLFLSVGFFLKANAIANISSVTIDKPSYCAGDSIKVTFTASGFTIGNIFTVLLSDSSGNNFPITLGTTSGTDGTFNVKNIVSVSSLSSLSYKVKVSGDNPSFTKKSSSFAINSLPILTNSTIVATCSGTSPNIALTSSSTPSTFSWTVGTITGGITGAIGGSGGTINQVLTNPSNTTAGTVEYNIIPTSQAGCTGPSTTITVTVNPSPVVTNPVTDTTCSGIGPGINLTSTIMSAFSWTIGTVTGGITGASSGTGGTINQVLTNPSNTMAGTVQYIITPTSFAGCTGPSVTVTLTVNPSPAVTNSMTASTCSGVGPEINLTSSIASTFSWSVGAITGNITGASSGSGATINQVLTNPSNATSGTVKYIVTPTSTAGCTGSALTITVTVNPIPIVTNSATVITCSGTSPNIALTSSSTPSTFSWTVGTITGGITGASGGSGGAINQVLTNPSNTTAGTVEYNIIPTSQAGCTGPSTTITVTVNPSPVVTNPVTDTTCSGIGPGINLTSTITSTFSWTVGTITGGITGASSGTGGTINQVLTNPSNTMAGTVQYIITPTSFAGCTGPSVTVTLTVNPSPAVTNSMTASTCSGVGPEINLTSSIASTFSWSVGAITGNITGASSGSGATINQVLTNPSNATSGTVKYIVTPTSTAGCTGSALTITVTVDPIPLVLNSPTVKICSGISPEIELTSSTQCQFSWIIGNLTGEVSGQSEGSGSLIDQILNNDSHSIDGTVEYYVTPISLEGCVGTETSITVVIEPLPQDPDFVSPNSLNNINVCSDYWGLFFSVIEDPNVSYIWSADRSGIPYYVVNDTDGFGNNNHNSLFFFHAPELYPVDVVTVWVTAIADNGLRCQSHAKGFKVNLSHDGVIDTAEVNLIDPVNNIIACFNNNVNKPFQWGSNDKLTLDNDTIPEANDQIYIAATDFHPDSKFYWVIARKDDCESKSFYNLDSTVWSIAPVGGIDLIEIWDKFSISLFPNPNNGLFNIQIHGSSSQKIELTVYDLMGKKEFSEGVSSTELEVGIPVNMQLPKGIYILRAMEQNGKSVVTKFIVQ